MGEVIMSMTVSADGFVNDRGGGIGWSAPNDELFRFHTEGIAAIGGYLLGRRLYEIMLPWENDPAMRSSEAYSAFADLWAALPKVVFSRSLEQVQGNARLARKPLAEEIAEATASADIQIGGTELAWQAVDLITEFRLFRVPAVIGGGTPYFPPVTEPLSLELAETRTFGPAIYECYRRTR